MKTFDTQLIIIITRIVCVRVRYTRIYYVYIAVRDMSIPRILFSCTRSLTFLYRFSCSSPLRSFRFVVIAGRQ